MKKIASLLIFVFTIQISIPALAQQVTNQTKELADCYEKLFNKGSKVISENVQKEVVYSAKQRLQFLHASAYFLGYQKTSTNRSIYSEMQQTFTFGTMAGGALLVGTIQLAKSLSNSKWKNTWILVSMGVLLSARIFMPSAELLSNTIPSSYVNLTNTTTEHDFFTQATSESATSKEVGLGLLNYCQEILETDLAPVLEKYSNMTEAEIKQLKIWASQ